MMSLMVEYIGYNGTIVIEADVLTLTHRGLPAKAAGLVTDQPRRIPLAAISDVRFKPANMVVNGWLTLGLGGASPPEPGGPGCPDGVVFRRKDSGTFKQLYEWLQGVAQRNQAEGIDQSAVDFEPAAETRLQRIERKQQERRAKQQVKDEERRAREAEFKERIGTRKDQRARQRALQERLQVDPELWPERADPKLRSEQPTRTATPARPAAAIAVTKVYGQRPPPKHPALAEIVAAAKLEPPRQPLEEQIEVAGETHHIKDIKRVFREAGTIITARGSTLEELQCVFVPEPWNPHDPNAVAVLVGSHHVGYIPADLAEDYADSLRELASTGTLVTGEARIWAKAEGSMVRARVTVLAPEPDTLP